MVADPGAHDDTGGLVSVLVARRRRHRHAATVCVYLLDVYCLGVKNAIGPDNMDDQSLHRFTAHVFSGYDAPPIPQLIDLARDLVLGSAEYAHALGFAAHPDFQQARAHLGHTDPTERDHVRTRRKAHLHRGALRQPPPRPSHPPPRSRTQRLPLHSHRRHRRTPRDRLTARPHPILPQPEQLHLFDYW